MKADKKMNEEILDVLEDKKRRYWTEEEIYKLKELKNKGLPYKEIAKQLNRTVSSCQTAVHDCKMRVDMVSKKIRDNNHSKVSPPKS